ncbi:MAG: hypothetical protein HDR43_03275 [Mycoplasma sp.]|nr:hypothetical protein [Mycoplasma sp.]
MNRYIKRKGLDPNRKSRFNTKPINISDDIVENESIKELTYKENADFDKNNNVLFNYAQENNNTKESNSNFYENSKFYEYQNNDSSNNVVVENNNENNDLNWDKLKLNKLKEKVIESSYINNGFFTNLENNYDVLDIYEIFNNFNNAKNKTDLEPIKTLINSSTPISINIEKNKELGSKIKRLFSLVRSTRANYGSSTVKIGWPYATGSIINKGESKEPLSQSQEINLTDLNTNNNLNNYHFYAPLLLWPLVIQTRDRKNFSLNLSRKNGTLIVEVNSHLLLTLIHSNNFLENNDNLSIKVDSFVKINYNDDLEIFANNIIEKYSSFGYTFSTDAINELKRILTSYEIREFIEIPKLSDKETGQRLEQTFGPINTSNIKVLPFATVGSYPIANVSLYIDYVKMLKSDGVGFINLIDNTFYNQLELAEEYHKYFSETSLKEIVKLDFSQKKACNVALNDNLVISGAAGNGKSQTISSIIANAVNNLKSVLFSTEKKEAANVIFNRLGRLRNYSLKLFESDNFAKEFTSQLKNGLERISLVYGIRDSIASTNTNVVSEKLDAIYKKVNDFKKIMMTEDGQNYPEYIFKKNIQKEDLKNVIHLVGPIIKNSDSSSDFWFKINKIGDDYHEYHQINKIKETLNFADDLFIQAFNVIKYYDGTDLFYDNYLIQYAMTKNIDEAIENLSEEKVSEFLSNREQVNLENYANDDKALYWSLYKLFQSLDDYSIDIIKSHDLNWYNKTSSLVKQKSTEQVVEFIKSYSPDEFDYEFYHSYYLMEKFAADHGDSFQVDNENYYEIIDNLITNKLGEDIRTTEFLFALKVVSVLKEDKKLASDFNNLYAIVKNTEVLNSVDDILINYSNIISLIFPLILGSPNMISKYVICKNSLFDICIIDEASMIPLENAFPLLYRSNRWIISGDIKQLPPATYQQNIEKYNKYQLMQSSIVENNNGNNNSNGLMKYKVFETPISLLEYIGTKIQTIVLEYHYRSVKKELFEFSNVVFYRNMIHVADDQNEQPPCITTGINLIKTNGICKNRINKVEAERVVKIVEQIVEQPNHGTIGIITTTNEQRDYIENLLLEHPSKLVTNEFLRISDDGEDNSMFVLTCEKVQGSERDNIIISFVASKDDTNASNFLSVNNTLGLLGEDVGPNYLNVLITRSRLALHLVTSFEIDEIIADNNQSLLILKDYLEYAKLLTHNGHNLNDPKIQAIFKPYIKNNAMVDFSNDMKGRAISRIAPDLKEDLEQLFAFEPRIEIVDGWYEGNVKIDLVIRDRRTKRNIIGIFCDEFIYDVMINGKQRDFYNRKFLETRNWKFFALSSLQWSKVYKRKSIIDGIINMLTLNLANWVEPLRITKINKYSIDENGNTIISNTLIRNSRNRLEVIEIDEPLYYDSDKEFLNPNNSTEHKKDDKQAKSKKSKSNTKKKSKSKAKNVREKILTRNRRR